MAKINLEVYKTSREAPSASGASVDLTDEIYVKLGFTQQVLVNLYEKFTGNPAKAGEFRGNHFLARECVEELNKVLLS